MEKDGSLKHSFYASNGNLSKVVRPNQYNPQADDGAGYQYIYDHQGRVLTVVGPNGHVLQTNTYDEEGRLLQQLDGLQTGAEFGYDLSGNRTHIKTSGGATQKLEYDARGNIVGVVDGNRNSTKENWKMGKPSDILTLRPNETIIKTIKGDCWGSFGVLHSQTAGTITLTDQRILFRGGGIVESLRLVFAIPYTDIVSIEPFMVSLFIPTGIRIVSQQEGVFRISVMKRKVIMGLIQEQMAKRG